MNLRFITLILSNQVIVNSNNEIIDYQKKMTIIMGLGQQLDYYWVISVLMGVV